MFGEDFERYEEAAAEEKPKVSGNGPAVPAPVIGKATKGKVAAKATALTYQFQIMESMGIPRSEVKKFADPHYWLSYFPPICVVSSPTVPQRIFSSQYPRKTTTPWAIV